MLGEVLPRSIREMIHSVTFAISASLLMDSLPRFMRIAIFRPGSSPAFRASATSIPLPAKIRWNHIEHLYNILYSRTACK